MSVFVTPTKDFFDFVEAHRNDDTAGLALSLAGKYSDFDMDFALVQIESRKAAARKLAGFEIAPRFLFPHRLSAEQCTAWQVALFHASLVKDWVKDSAKIVDLTAGLGIDAMAMSMSGFDVTAIDINPVTSACLNHNSAVMGLVRITALCADSERWLSDFIKSADKNNYNVAFIDPARRDAKSKRTYAFTDCSPDVSKLMPTLMQAALIVMVKASPMLDIKSVFEQLPEARLIYSVALRGECKEVLAVAGCGLNEKCVEDENGRMVYSVDIDGQGSRSVIGFGFDDIGKNPGTYVNEDALSIGKFLIEPSAALMKVAPWKSLCERFNISKIAPDTHLFVSDTIPVGFAGRVCKIENKLKSADLKRLKGLKLNLVTRNYNTDTATLRKRLKISDGGDEFLYAFRDAYGKSIHLLCSKV